MGCDSRVSFLLCLHILPSLFYGVQKLVKTKSEEIVTSPCPKQNASVCHNQLLCRFSILPYELKGNGEEWNWNLIVPRRIRD